MKQYSGISKCRCILGVCAVCILGMLLAGCSIYDIYDKKDRDKIAATPGDADMNTEQKEAGEKPDTISKDKSEDTVELRDYSKLSTKKYAWYVVRNKNHEMSGCDNSIQIDRYDAYYVDRKCAESGEKTMYLTFDCGYENGYTEQMLDILKKHGAKACFFVTMTYIRDNPDIVKRMKEEGHQVGNHTVHHPCMPEKSVEDQKSEIRECSEFMKSETGYDMDMYFRPPSGEYSEQVLQLAKDMGYKTIFWSMAYLDYDVNSQPGAEYVADHFAKYHHPGAIPLMHNVSSSNAQALDRVLTDLEKEGYEFRSLDNLNCE